MKRTREEWDAERRKRTRESILAAAVEEAKIEGVQFITRERVAERARVAEGSINRAFGTMLGLKRAVLQHGVTHEVLEIVKDGLAAGSPITANIDPALRSRAAALLASVAYHSKAKGPPLCNRYPRPSRL